MASDRDPELAPTCSPTSSMPGDGPLTVCAYSFGSDLVDAGSEDRAVTHMAEIPVICKPIEPDARVVVVSVPPPPRFE